MFETCMVESAGQLRSRNTRWTTAGAFALEGTLLALVVLATMVHTDTIRMGVTRFVAPISTPLLRTEIVPTSGTQGGGSNPFVAPREIPREIPSGNSGHTTIIGRESGPGPDVPTGFQLSGPTIPYVADGPRPAVSLEKQRIKLSSIDPARLVQQINPPYPPLAKQAGVQGAVILHAIIARDGSIESLQVVNGHPMLTNAALDAVCRWRYKPTLLGGQPVEVETTITVNFRLGAQ